jgi:hypothetical protein
MVIRLHRGDITLGRGRGVQDLIGVVLHGGERILDEHILDERPPAHSTSLDKRLARAGEKVNRQITNFRPTDSRPCDFLINKERILDRLTLAHSDCLSRTNEILTDELSRLRFHSTKKSKGRQEGEPPSRRADKSGR